MKLNSLFYGIIAKYDKHLRASMRAIEADKTYLFTKSGNKVRAIAPTTRWRGQAMWEVERVDGASVGKRMDVPASALEPVDEHSAPRAGTNE